MESAYTSASTVGRLLLGLLHLLNDIGIAQGAAPFYEDNSAAHRLITSECVVRGALHFNVRYHIVQGLQLLGSIDMRQ